MRWLWRQLKRLWRRVPLGIRLLGLLLTPLLALNLAVAFFGSSAVFPLSPFFLEEKWNALRSYARHRPSCLLRGHPDLGPLVAEAEKKYALPSGLLAALVEVESGSESHRISRAGAMGPAQLMPGTAAELGVKDPFDPTQAIDGSARYLAQLLRRMKQVPLAVAAYNAGPGAVRGEVPRNGETEFYVEKVMRAYAATAAAAP